MGLGLNIEVPPNGVEPVDEINWNQLQGKWYEIARLDNEIEQGIGQAVLDSKQKNTGDFELSLKGEDKKEVWLSTAHYNPESKMGSIFIPCFGPFDCGLHVIDIDKKNHEWMVVTGKDRTKLWIFAKAPGIQKKLLEELISKTEDLGYNSDELELNNREVINPKPADSKSSEPSPANPVPPQTIVPEEPANIPPPPTFVPTVPFETPSVPKEVPPVPSGVPQMGLQPKEMPPQPPE